MSRRMIPLAFVASLVLAASLPAQSTRSSLIGTDIFWVHNREQNAQVSPLRYSGGGSGAALAYGTGTDAWCAGFQLLSTSTQLQSGISQNREHAGTARRLELSLPYQRRVFAEASRLAGLTLGAQLTGDLLVAGDKMSRPTSAAQAVLSRARRPYLLWAYARSRGKSGSCAGKLVVSAAA